MLQARPLRAQDQGKSAKAPHPLDPRAWCCQPNRSVLGDLVTGLDDLIEVFLECPLLVTDEAEDMVQREPLDVGRVLVKIGADTVQFGEEFF